MTAAGHDPAHQRATLGRATTPSIATTTRATSRRAALRACELFGCNAELRIVRKGGAVEVACTGCGLTAAQRAAGEGA